MDLVSTRVPSDLWYPFFAFILLGILLVFVPRRFFRHLFLEGLLWGSMPSFLVAAGAPLVGLFRYAGFGPFGIWRVPFFIPLAWAPAVMLFLHLKPPMRHRFPFWLHILAFAGLTGFIDAILQNLGLMEYIRWSPLARFFMSLVWFYAASYFHEHIMPRWREQEE